MKNEAHGLNRCQFRRWLPFISPWVLLALGIPGLAWTEKDCNQSPYGDSRQGLHNSPNHGLAL